MCSMRSAAGDPCCGRLGEREGAWRIATGRIGWIGTGRMGAALVTRLLKAASGVAAYRRTRSKAGALAALEAAVVDSPTGLVDWDVVSTMVSGPADLLDVTCGEGGVLTAGAAPGVRRGFGHGPCGVRRRHDVPGRASERQPKVDRSERLTLAISGGGDVRLRRLRRAVPDKIKELPGQRDRVGAL
jgi:6-phosphogluconate dehydrogenase-like protein